MRFAPRPPVLIKWLIIVTICGWLIHEGIVNGPIGRMNDLYDSRVCSMSTAQVEEPWTVVSVGYATGEAVRELGEVQPEDVTGAVAETFEMLGATAAAFKLGAMGEPIPEKMATWEAQAVTAAYGDAECDPVAPDASTVVAGFPPVEPGGWGGHGNGRIPSPAMCAPKTAPGHRLRCDAATAYDAMSRAYAATFGTPMSLTDSYRDFQGQVRCRAAKGNMCADPGTSNHGWGLAVDLGGGVNRFGTPQHEWMRRNGPGFGFVHPTWAQQGGSKPEAWHFEYGGPVSAG